MDYIITDIKNPPSTSTEKRPFNKDIPLGILESG